jgi:DNA-binding MarR family transcriptional regulator
MTALDTVSRELVSLLRGLRELHGTVADASRYAVDPSGVAILARLDELGPCRLSTLAGVLCLDLSTVSRQVPALERSGWVARERDPEDHRAQLLDLTTQGREVLMDVRRSRNDVLARLLPDWSEDELEAFAAQLHRFNHDVTSNRSALPGQTALTSTGTDSR